MLDTIKVIWGFFVDNAKYIAIVGPALLGATYIIANLYTIRKLRLEIRKLRIELQEHHSTSLATPSLDEIVQFTSRNPSTREIRRFIQSKRSLLQKQGPTFDLPEAKVRQYVAALTQVDRSFESSFWEILNDAVFVTLIIIVDSIIFSAITDATWYFSFGYFAAVFFVQRIGMRIF